MKNSTEQFWDAVAIHKVDDRLTAESGASAAESLKLLRLELSKPTRGAHLVSFFRGELGVSDQAAAVYVARLHGQAKAAEAFLSALKKQSADDVIKTTEQLIARATKRDAAADLLEADGEEPETDHEIVPSLFVEEGNPQTEREGD